MNDKAIVYVAGNPDAYPLEYYDAGTQTFQGVIPRLLEQFSTESRYDLIYYQAGEADRREQLASNIQVDIVSGFADGDAIPAENTTVFTAMIDGMPISYYLGFTEAASDMLKTDLETFLGSLSAQEVSGLVIDTAAAAPPPTNHMLTISALAIGCALLLSALALLVRRYRRKWKSAIRDLERDRSTGLGNLDYLTRWYKQVIGEKNRVLYHLIYFHIDTDRLRRFVQGHELDAYLRHVATVLQEHASPADETARVSEHGFALLKLAGNEESLNDWIKPVFSHIRSYAIAESFPFDFVVTAGIYPLHATDDELDDLIFVAFRGALLAAREEKDYIFCSGEMLDMLAEERQLQKDVERALINREFQLYIQFYVNVNSARIVGGEALSRWNHPSKGILTPNRFIPLLEKEKLISKLDYYALREVCALLADLCDNRIETFFMSCNFSRETFSAPDFVDRCKTIMNEYRFPRELLICEITESAAVRNTAQIRQNVLALKELGVSIVLDDFGEGFSSFYDLQKYPLDGLKLNKSLIDNILSATGKAILKGLIQVGHELGMTILAEGVETDEQVEALQALNCDVIQGFRFYYPLPAWDAKEKILETLNEQQS